MIKQIVEKYIIEDYSINDLKNPVIKNYVKERLKKFSSDALKNLTIARALMVERIAEILAGECGVSVKDLVYEVSKYEGEKHLSIKAQKDDKQVSIYLNIYINSQESEFLIYYDIVDEDGYPDPVKSYDNIEFEKSYDIITQFNVIYNKIKSDIVKFCKTGSL